MITKITSFTLLICCFILTAGQKKKKKLPERPPAMEKVTPSISDEYSNSDEVDYSIVVPIAHLGENLPVQKPSIAEKINIPSNAEKCACKNVEIIFAADKLGEGITLKDHTLKGNVKSLTNVEKRDTSVGFTETLSKGNTVELQFSENGWLKLYSIITIIFLKDYKINLEYSSGKNASSAKIQEMENFQINLEYKKIEKL